MREEAARGRRRPQELRAGLVGCGVALRRVELAAGSRMVNAGEMLSEPFRICI